MPPFTAPMQQTMAFSHGILLAVHTDTPPDVAKPVTERHQELVAPVIPVNSTTYAEVGHNFWEMHNFAEACSISFDYDPHQPVIAGRTNNRRISSAAWGRAPRKTRVSRNRLNKSLPPKRTGQSAPEERKHRSAHPGAGGYRAFMPR